MTRPASLHARVAERAQGLDIAITAAGVAEIDRLLREEREIGFAMASDGRVLARCERHGTSFAPDAGCPDCERRAAVNEKHAETLAALASRPVEAPKVVPLHPMVDRDPCPRCGVRADIGCTHSRAAFGLTVSA